MKRSAFEPKLIDLEIETQTVAILLHLEDAIDVSACFLLSREERTIISAVGINPIYILMSILR